MYDLCGFQLCHASEAAGSFNRNQPSQQELSAQCKLVLDHVPVLIAAVSEVRRNPDSVQAVRSLIDTSKALLQVRLPCLFSDASPSLSYPLV